MMSYSVLMAVYYKENPRFLEESIESILNQTVKTNDFVIVEDGLLTKELNEVIQKYSANYEEIKVIKQAENKGLGIALNLGLGNCINDLVARMDSDDVSEPNRCEKQLLAFGEDDVLAICGTDIIEFDPSRPKHTCYKKMPVKNEELLKYAKSRNPFNHPTVMYKKQAVLECGGYLEEQRGEDFALFTKMLFKGYKGMNISQPLLKYRATKQQYDRRTSKSDLNAVMNVMKRNLDEGYITKWDYIRVKIRQYIALLLPWKIGGFLFKLFYR